MSGIKCDFGVDCNSEGKPYHEHGDKIEKKTTEPAENHEEKGHVAPHNPHGHNNQYHKDIKGSTGSGSSEPGDRKADKETKQQ